MNEVYSILTRMRELTVQASNDTYSSTDRGQIRIEFNQLRTEISRISSDVNFNRIGVLNSTDTLQFQIGINNASNNQFSIAMSTVAASIGTLGISTGAAGIALTTGGTVSLGMMKNSITLIDNALSSVNDRRARLGAFQNRLESSLNTAANYSQNLASAASQISDVDYATESANLAKAQVQQQVGAAMLAQANAAPQLVLQLIQ